MRSRSRSRQLWVFGAIFILALASSILFRDFEAPECTQLVKGPLSTQVLINCDSAQIVQDSQTPSRLWNAKTSYQDRPLYTLAGYVISKPLRLLSDSFEIYSNTQGEPITFYYANYLAFIFLNIILLMLVLWQSIKLVRQLMPDRQMFGQTFFLGTVLSLLVANNVVKGFVWTPHTQIFNLLLVIYSINLWLEVEASESNRIKTRHYFAIGLLLFFYPMFVLLYLIPLLRNWKSHILPTLISISPYLIYPTVLELFGGEYRNAAVEDFDGFVWVLRSFDRPGIILEKMSLFTNAFLVLPIFYFALILSLYAILKHKGKLFKDGWRYFVFIGAFAAFIFLMGYSGPRLAFPILACLLLYLLVYQIRIHAKRESIVTQAVVSGFVLAIFLITQGPLS